MEKHTLLQICVHDQYGFEPVIRFQSWRIAMSNAMVDERAVELSRHMETDESFVLLHGECTLLVVDSDETYGSVHAVRMCQQVVYNVPKGVWHTHLMKANTKLLIVENEDTGAVNSQRMDLSPEEGVRLERLAAKATDSLESIYSTAQRG